MTVSDSYLDQFARQEHLEYVSTTKKPRDSNGKYRRVTRLEYLEYWNSMRITATRPVKPISHKKMKAY